MPLIIDGHNLIPNIPWLSLDSLDDEIQLIQLLQEFSRIRRVQIECYFDKAISGYERNRRYGTVKVKFANPGKSADDEIRGRLIRLGREARNWTVISSDLQVQTEARARGSRVLAAHVFAREMIQIVKNGSGGKNSDADRELSQAEVESWLKMFGIDETKE